MDGAYLAEKASAEKLEHTVAVTPAGKYEAHLRRKIVDQFH